MRYTEENPLKILSLGWGVQSWTLAAMAALGELPKPDYAIHADTRHEMSGTYAHAEKWTPWLLERGIKVITVSADNTSPTYPGAGQGIKIPAFGEKGQTKRQCTNDWKIRPIRKFVRRLIDSPRSSHVDMWQGISIDEWQRMRSSDVNYISNVYPLVDRRMSRASCVNWLETKGLDIPPKSSCTFCPYHSGPTWKELKRDGGSDWMEAVNVDADIRNKFPGRVYLHRARVNLPNAVNIPEDHGAKQLELPCDSGYCFN
jgi:hypothetical protein